MLGETPVQDFIMGGLSIFMSYALIPQVVKGFKEKKGPVTIQTSFINALAVVGYVVCGFTMGLRVVPFVWATCAVLWLILLLQRLKWGEDRDGRDT
jgi:hypothetical protein